MLSMLAAHKHPTNQFQNKHIYTKCVHAHAHVRVHVHMHVLTLTRVSGFSQPRLMAVDKVLSNTRVSVYVILYQEGGLHVEEH